MKLSTAIEFFKSLQSETDRKSEIKVYEGFIGILTGLEKRNLSEEALDEIEEELDFLEIDGIHENMKRHYNRKLSAFKKYLKEEHALISEGYYTAVGIALGVAFGAAFGSMFEMGSGIALGICIGLAIGASMDATAKKENRVLITKLS